MSRPAQSSPDGKRDFEVKVHLTEAEYEDAVCLKRACAMGSLSELFRQLLHIQSYGLLGTKASPPVDEMSRGGTVPMRAVGQ